MKDRIRTRPRGAAPSFLETGLLLGLILSLLAVGVALAAGNISATDKWAWSTNAGWINFNPANGGVTVYNDHLEGYAWAENGGWIRLGAYTGGGTHTYLNTSNTDYGVNRNTGTGALSGYAWSTTAGWVNFAPTNGGVTVSDAGVFSGYAWGENIGWIKFNGTALNSTAYKVATAGPLAVTLVSFAAEATPDGALVRWETVSEVDNAGFNLFRNTTANTVGDLLANVPSQAPGSTQGFTYSYDDGDVQAGETYWYWLEDVSLRGATTLHGPVSVTAQAPTAVRLAGFEAAAGTRAPFAGLVLVAGLAAAVGLVWRRRRQEAVR